MSALICGKREGDGEDDRSGGGGEDSGIETIDLDIVVATDVGEVVNEDDDGGVSKTTEDEASKSIGKIGQQAVRDFRDVFLEPSFELGISYASVFQVGLAITGWVFLGDDADRL